MRSHLLAAALKRRGVLRQTVLRDLGLLALPYTIEIEAEIEAKIEADIEIKIETEAETDGGRGADTQMPRQAGTAGKQPIAPPSGWVAAAAASLATHGFCLLTRAPEGQSEGQSEGLLPSALCDACAAASSERLSTLLSRARALGFDPTTDKVRPGSL